MLSPPESLTDIIDRYNKKTPFMKASCLQPTTTSSMGYLQPTTSSLNKKSHLQPTTTLVVRRGLKHKNEKTKIPSPVVLNEDENKCPNILPSTPVNETILVNNIDIISSNSSNISIQFTETKKSISPVDYSHNTLREFMTPYSENFNNDNITAVKCSLMDEPSPPTYKQNDKKHNSRFWSLLTTIIAIIIASTFINSYYLNPISKYIINNTTSRAKIYYLETYTTDLETTSLDRYIIQEHDEILIEGEVNYLDEKSIDEKEFNPNLDIIIDDNSDDDIIDSNSDDDIADNNSDHGIIDNNSDHDIIDNNSDHDITDSNSDEDIIDSNSDDDIIDSNSDDDIIDSNSDDDIIDDNSDDDIVDNNSEFIDEDQANYSLESIDQLVSPDYELKRSACFEHVSIIMVIFSFRFVFIYFK